MRKNSFYFLNKDGMKINTYVWEPEKEIDVKGIIQIAHGMAETALRYERFAEKLTERGYKVYANDHRGHGLTAKSIEELGYISDNDGFEDMVEDMHQLTDIIKKENQFKPVFLFGHSMGSFLSQRYAEIYGQDIQGLILCGTNGKPQAAVNLGIVLAKMEMNKKGSKAKSPRLNSMSFGSFNKAFMPTRTEFDWLSRDSEEVDKYIKDPYCGSVFTTSFYYYFLKGLKRIHNKENLNKIPKTLPIYIFAGDMDPVGSNGKGILSLIDILKKLGMKSVSYKLYKEGRHEMLNETNREEVMKDTIDWIDAAL